MGALRLGISTCPNDTFAFAALLQGRVAGPDLEAELLDIEALNQGLFADRFDLAKASFHAAFALAGDYLVLPVGAALGFGVGPLLLSRDRGDLPGPGDRVLSPGAWTTATLLYRLHVPEGPAPRPVPFSEVLPALLRGEADFGLVIHEGRFTFRDLGLRLVADLGELWEGECGAPLPLGGILARRSLGRETAREMARALRDSLQAAREDPASALPFMRRHAPGVEDEVLWQHVHTYVNEATLDLGEEGRQALRLLGERARGLVDPFPCELEVL